MDSRWIRARTRWPLLLSAAVLFIAGALMFFKAGDTIQFSTTNETGAT
jgi:uncharacterized membrane protein HdeD (DUF308 family)